jgi:diaminopimelate epimerase
MISFSKYQGCGNDFILIDNRDAAFSIPHPQFVLKICHRQLGIGADGLILLEESQKADFKMRILNSDGSEAEMCGNGIRCLLKFIEDLGEPHSSYIIETKYDKLKVAHQEAKVSVVMPFPKEVHWSINLPIEETHVLCHYLDTGVPHVVIFMDDIDAIDLKTYAPQIRHHCAFAPRGVNVNIAKTDRQGQVWVRTFERGVEQETLACGTGAIAAAVAAAHQYSMPSPIAVRTRSKETLEIALDSDHPHASSLTMTGPARKIYQGTFLLQDFIS